MTSQPKDPTPLTVTVAAYGPSAGEIFGPMYFDGPTFLGQGEGVPWEARQKVTLTVEPTVTLGEIIDQAAEEFGLRVARPGTRWQADRTVSEVIDGVAFYKEVDDQPYASPYPWLKVFSVVITISRRRGIPSPRWESTPTIR